MKSGPKDTQNVNQEKMADEHIEETVRSKGLKYGRAQKKNQLWGHRNKAKPTSQFSDTTSYLESLLGLKINCMGQGSSLKKITGGVLVQA